MKSISRKSTYTRLKTNILGVNVDFSKEPVTVSDEIAEYCAKNFPDRFEVKESLNKEQQLFIDNITDTMDIDQLKKVVTDYELLPSLKGSGNIQSPKAFKEYVLKKLE